MAGSFVVAAAAHRIDQLGALGVGERATRLERIGIQLYTVRRPAAVDLAGTLQRIAHIGFNEVEFAGFYGHPASDVRKMLDDTGLAAPSAHIAFETIRDDPHTFDDAHAVGLQWIVAPSLPRGPLTGFADWQRVADQFNELGAKVNAAGFRFAYHNHNEEFKKVDGNVPLEILLEHTDPAVVAYEMDIYWAVSGGADPLDLLARYPGRFKMFHVKDGHAPFTDASQTDVGRGTIDFMPILAHGAGIEHYFIESDSAADPFAFAAASYHYLTNLTF